MRSINILALAVVLSLCYTQIALGSIDLSDIRDYVHTEPCYDSGLKGDDIIIGIWEAADRINQSHKVDDSLQEFENRVTIVEDSVNISPHATSVAFIIGSNSNDIDNRGMAPEIEMLSYSSGNDYNEIKTAGVDLTTHSYGYNTSLGAYLVYSQRFDKAIRENNTISFKTTGNEFKIHKNATGSGYWSINRSGTAKNIITVGATNNSHFDELADFSSAGPTNDGRLKPEIVAPGYLIDLNPNPYPSQNPISGTSFACPVVSGSAALVLEQWQKNHQEEMLPSTMKALLVHTANNDGNGPTFRSGYGMLDTQEAVELVILDEKENANNTIIQDFNTFTARGNNSTDFIFTVPADTREFGVTLAWSDKEGLDDVDDPLFDLDLVVHGPGGSTYEPWILNHTSPEAPATTGSDRLNPLEMVQIEDPDPGTYTINISGSIDEPSQSFSLVTSTKYDGFADIVLVIDNSGSMAITDPTNLRLTAANLFVDLARDDDQLAIVSINTMGSLIVPLQKLRDNRSSMKSAINALSQGGNSYIGDGLWVGYNQLNGANALLSHSKLAILLTDGHETTLYAPVFLASDVVPYYISKGWPIYTIAHSDYADENFMENIAQATGGVYYKTKLGVFWRYIPGS